MMASNEEYVQVDEDAFGNGKPSNNGTDNGTYNGTDNGTENGIDNGIDDGTDNGTDDGTDDGTDNGHESSTPGFTQSGSSDDRQINGTVNGGITDQTCDSGSLHFNQRTAPGTTGGTMPSSAEAAEQQLRGGMETTASSEPQSACDGPDGDFSVRVASGGQGEDKERRVVLKREMTNTVQEIRDLVAQIDSIASQVKMYKQDKQSNDEDDEQEFEEEVCIESTTGVDDGVATTGLPEAESGQGDFVSLSPSALEVISTARDIVATFDSGKKYSLTQNKDQSTTECGSTSRLAALVYPPVDIQRTLADAIRCRFSLDKISYIIKCGADVNGNVKNGLRPIHYAVYENYIECLSMLIEKGSDVDAQDDTGYTPLHLCAKHGLYECMEELIKHKAHVNYCSDQFVTGDLKTMGYLTFEPLNLAIENNRIRCVRLLLQNGAYPNNKYFLGHEINLIPLENIECLEELLKYRADPNTISRCGLTPLMKACKEQAVGAVNCLLQYGADVNKQCPPKFEEKTALHIAIPSGNADIVQLLLEAGAKTDRPESFKSSPLDIAVTYGRLEICHLLIKHSADVNEVNDDKHTPLMTACASVGMRNQREIIHLLLENGADPLHHQSFVSYISPSLSALVEYLDSNQFYDIEIFRDLLKYGSRVNLRFASRRTRLLDPYGVVQSLQKLNDYSEIFRLVLQATQFVSMSDVRVRMSRLNPNHQALLIDKVGKPSCLIHLSRCSVREHLSCPVPDNVHKLPLPEFIREYILYLR